MAIQIDPSNKPSFESVPLARKRWRKRSQLGFLRKPRLQRAGKVMNEAPLRGNNSVAAIDRACITERDGAIDAISDEDRPRAAIASKQTDKSTKPFAKANATSNATANATTNATTVAKNHANNKAKNAARILGSIALAMATSHAHSANVWINEIHYDNSGVDVNEGVEIAGPAGQSLDGWQLQLYNGGSGEVYRTLDLATTFFDSYNGFGIVHVLTGSLQNGPADGFALLDIDGDVVEFISYEGQLTATDGGAAGITSVDIGISEDSESPEGLSLQLVGAGSQASDFSWTTGFNSLGVANFGQNFIGATNPVPLPAAAWLFGTAMLSLSPLRRLQARHR